VDLEEVGHLPDREAKRCGKHQVMDIETKYSSRDHRQQRLLQMNAYLWPSDDDLFTIQESARVAAISYEGEFDIWARGQWCKDVMQVIITDDVHVTRTNGLIFTI
jgi:hypothetical protein